MRAATTASTNASARTCWTDGGVSFAVWAPSAAGRAGDRRLHLVGPGRRAAAAARRVGRLGGRSSPDATEGQRYKFLITRGRRARSARRPTRSPSRPRCHRPPRRSCTGRGTSGRTASGSSAGPAPTPSTPPMSVYEVHLGSWRRNPLEGDRELDLHRARRRAGAYCTDMGFTHVELLPVMAHPFAGSWGYQVTSYFAPSPKWGTPDEFKGFVDRLHQNGVGRDPRLGAGALPPRRVGAGPLRRHLALRARRPPAGRPPRLGHARVQLRAPRGAQLPASPTRSSGSSGYHADGLRVDAVASMLYLDYSRKAGEWVPEPLRRP